MTEDGEGRPFAKRIRLGAPAWHEGRACEASEDGEGLKRTLFDESPPAWDLNNSFSSEPDEWPAGSGGPLGTKAPPAGRGEVGLLSQPFPSRERVPLCAE